MFWGIYKLKQQLMKERQDTIRLILRHTAQIITPPLKYKVKSEIERILQDLVRFEFIKGAKVVWEEPTVYKELGELDAVIKKKEPHKIKKFTIIRGDMDGKIISYQFEDRSGMKATLEVAINDRLYQKIIKNIVVNFAIIGLFSTVLLCVVIYFYYYYIVASILRLVEHIRKIRTEETLKPVVLEKGPKEIIELVQVFNELIENINKYRNHLEKILEQWKSEAVKAKSASQAKTKFLANVSHEIRTPMTAAMGMLEMLKEESSLADKEKLRHLEVALKSLGALIEETLDFAKLEEGKEEIKEETFNITELGKEIHELFEIEAQKKNLVFEVFISLDIPKELRGDISKIRQIIINLISNAIKFTDKGKITLRIFPEKVGEKFIWLHFEVKDTGCGIPPSELEKIFNPYERLEDLYNKPYPGTGLGLAISKRLAELLGGKLWAESEGLGRGAIFHLLIPLKRAESDSPIQKTPPKKLKGKVLLAEDNPVNQLYFKRVLEKLGLNVEVASDGLEALNVINEKHFDLIILDIRMPGLSGLEIVKRIRKKGISIPIIALTAHSVSEIEKEALASGFDDFLQKPISREELAQKLAKWLS
ncbi:response regulator [Thermodesulfatator indicus]|nr:response regulator [Thermodesulfatator indicus]